MICLWLNSVLFQPVYYHLWYQNEWVSLQPPSFRQKIKRILSWIMNFIYFYHIANHSHDKKIVKFYLLELNWSPVRPFKSLPDRIRLSVFWSFGHLSWEIQLRRPWSKLTDFGQNWPISVKKDVGLLCVEGP